MFRIFLMKRNLSFWLQLFVLYRKRREALLRLCAYFVIVLEDYCNSVAKIKNMLTGSLI